MMVGGGAQPQRVPRKSYGAEEAEQGAGGILKSLCGVLKSFLSIEEGEE
jgi:hypothetical protein